MKKSIYRQLLSPMIAIVCVLSAVLTMVVVAVFSISYERDILAKTKDKATLVGGEIKTFLDGAYGVTQELSVNPSILTMDTDVQTPILEGCVARNDYLELLYIQDTTGMQTGRSSGELADRSTRWWFIKTMDEKKPFVSKSYYSVNTGMPCASIFFPMYNDDVMIGVFAVDIKLDYLLSLIQNYSDMDNGQYSFIIDGEGVVVAHPDNAQIEELYNYKTCTRTVSKKDANGNPLTDAEGNILEEELSFDVSSDFMELIKAVMGGSSDTRKIKFNGDTYYASYEPIEMRGESDAWSIITLHRQVNAMAPVRRVMLIAVLVWIVAVLAAVLIISRLAKRLTCPIRSITELIKDASEGDFTRKADENIENELGELSGSFNRMTDKISGILTRITTFSAGVIHSSGNLRVIEEKVNDISNAIKEISSGAEEQNEDVQSAVEYADRLEAMFERLQTLNKELDTRMNSTIHSEHDGAKSVQDLKTRNELMIRKMESTYDKILKLNDQSQRISCIMETINDISDETGLLALNASIEAARAGEAGRGFAVVAESVANLASESSQSAQNITTIVEELQNCINETVKDIVEMKEGIENQYGAVEKVEGSFEDFRLLVNTTKDSVDEIENLVDEMRDCDTSMAKKVQDIGKVSSHMVHLSEHAADSMALQLTGISDVSERIDALSKASSEIEAEMTKFRYEKEE